MLSALNGLFAYAGLMHAIWFTIGKPFPPGAAPHAADNGLFWRGRFGKARRPPKADVPL